MRTLSELLFNKKPSDPANSKALEDYHAHGYLGNMYLSLGDLVQAELEYSRAYALYPSDEVKAKLAAVRRLRSRSFSTARPDSATRAA